MQKFSIKWKIKLLESKKLERYCILLLWIKWAGKRQRKVKKKMWLLSGMLFVFWTLASGLGEIWEKGILGPKHTEKSYLVHMRKPFPEEKVSSISYSKSETREYFRNFTLSCCFKIYAYYFIALFLYIKLVQKIVNFF